MIKYKVLDNTLENATMLEHLRLSSYGFTPTEEDYDESYIKDICTKRILPFIIIYKDKIVGGSYVSNTLNSLYIDYLFILPEYQEKGLRLGRQLLKFILKNKQLVEEYFDTNFTQSKLCATNEKTKKLYTKMGYKEIGEEMYCKKLGN